jgi:hypothetical protein
MLTKKFVVLQKTMEVFVEKAELFIKSAFVLHNFIIKVKKMEMKVFYEKRQQNQKLKISVISHVMWQLRQSLVLMISDRNLQTISFLMSEQFIYRIITCSRPLPYYH